MQQQDPNDEIDLVTLFFRLWQQKKRIVLIAVFGGVLALAITFLLPKKWTTQTQIVAPRNFEIVTALQRSLTYANITSSEKIALNQGLYNTFLSELSSRDTRADFFKQSELFKKLSQGKSETQKANILRALVTRQLTIKWHNEKRNTKFPTVSFTASDPKDAQETLTQYLQYLNVRAMHLHDKDFALTVQNQVDTLNYRKQAIEARLNDTQKIKLENLNLALKTARKAGIRDHAHSRADCGRVLALSDAKIKPTDNQQNENSFLFLLGQNYLQAQINSINSSDPTFPLEYYTIRQQLPLLEKLLAPQDSALTDQSFHYQSAPFLPLESSNPSRSLITLMGFLIGLAVACVYVLLHDAINTYRPKKASPHKP